ncbi:MAG: hypothetical protein EXQ94_12225 [Alphaproteobacteria bacterium]|nr:hypothetical protein [Alphaproteobacteria bacterium]
MIRILLEVILPLLLPFVGYGIWLHFARRKAELIAAGALPSWQDAPWTWLVVTGIGLAVASVLALVFVGGAAPGSRYIPPSYVDGQVVPGRTE